VGAIAALFSRKPFFNRGGSPQRRILSNFERVLQFVCDNRGKYSPLSPRRTMTQR
jgi:hypothetical protein